MRSTTAFVRPQRADRLHRRRLRASLAAVVLAAVAVTGVIVVAPAEAKTAAPKLKLVAGDKVITAAWPAVAGATSYTLRMSKKRSMSNAKVVTTTKRTVKLKAANGHPYYFSFTASSPAITSSLAKSAVTTMAASAGVPYAVNTVTATSGPEANQVTVSWTGGGRAKKVAVVAGSEVLTKGRTFHSAWYPATTRSIVITVPVKYRKYVGAGSGNPVWVKVVESNATSTAYGASYSYTRKYRPTPPGKWAFAAATTTPDAAVSRLTVAELNTQSVGATVHYSATNQWAKRAGRVAAAINTTSPAPDLLMTAELATNVIDSCRNTLKLPYQCSSHTQVADLASRLNTLTLADTDTYDRVADRMRTSPSWDGQVTNGAHVFYNPNALTLLDHGFYAPAMSPSSDFADVEGLGVTPWDKTTVGSDRWLTWAKFETKDGSGRQFYAVAAHFPVGNAAATVNARATLVHALLAKIDARAGSLPVVFGGDINSDATRSAKPVQPAFISDGWFDAAAVAKKSLRTGMKVSTANGSGTQAKGYDPGYGPKPITHPYETSRIDYILLRNSPHTYWYKNVLRVDSKGNFIKSVQGTDHNMQLAQIGIGDPVS
jgi:hypothetical protein